MRLTIQAAFTVALAVVTIAMTAQFSHAQTEPITFTQTGGSSVSSLTFPFNFNSSASFTIDQLIGQTFDVTNGDQFGLQVVLGLAPSSPVTSFGVVQPGDRIDPDDSETTSTFAMAPGETELDILSEAEMGDDIFVGFLSDDSRAGFFLVSFDDADGGEFNGSLTFSEGQIGIEANTAVTVPSAIPEPSALALLALLGGVATCDVVDSHRTRIGVWNQRCYRVVVEWNPDLTRTDLPPGDCFNGEAEQATGNPTRKRGFCDGK